MDVIGELLERLKEHSLETYGHSLRVSLLAEKLAKALNLPKDKIASIKKGGLLHDIGKIKIRRNLLHYKKVFDPRKNELAKHPNYGYELLKGKVNDKIIIYCVLFHQEFFNGEGYPYGLKGEEIPIEARIVKVADTWDALISKRSYKEPIQKEEGIKMLKECKGNKLDPKIVDVFLGLIKKD